MRTDHSALQWGLNFEETEGEVARWIQQLEEYDFQMQHCKGMSHPNADGLSQRPYDLECKQCQRIEKNDARIPKLILTQPMEWRQGQFDDDDISPILRAKEQNVPPGWADISDQSRELKILWPQ